MKTTMYLIRHAAAQVARGQFHDQPLGKLGIRQAEVTRDFMAVRPIDCCYCSPLLRAIETAAIIAAPHGIRPITLSSLASSAQAAAVLAEVLTRHEGQSILVVVHHDVGRDYLGCLLGVPAEQACQLQLDNCGISMVVREGTAISVNTLNASFHLQGLAA